MKAISIRQPWASLTAAGIRDIDISNRDTKYRGSVLIVASSRRVGKDFGHDIPIDWYCRVRNAQALGFIPYDEEMPLSCVVGIAHLEDCNTLLQNSPWTAEGNNWVLKDAKLLANPIYGVKGKQGLFDVHEIEEEQLPVLINYGHPCSEYRDGIFSISMTEHEIERQIPNWLLTLIICGDNLAEPVIISNQGKLQLKEIKKLRLVSNSIEKEINVINAQIYKEEYPRSFQYIAFELE